MKSFKGRVIVSGTCTASALVSRVGFNTLASYQTPMMMGDKEVKCSDQNNPDLYKKSMIGKALCLPQTIGSTTGGMALYTVLSTGKQPARRMRRSGAGSPSHACRAAPRAAYSASG